MEQIISTVTAWPIILQGALGSGLFAIASYVFQKLYSYTSRHITIINKEHRRSRLRNDLGRCIVLTTYKEEPEKAGFLMVSLVYTAIEDISKALLMLVFGAIVSSFIPIFEYVGYVMAVYYLIQALDSVRSWDNEKEPATEIERIEKELNDLNA